ncbi:MAG: phosphodiester glycosidase family protein [Actinomycetota bacterium]
MRRLISIIAGFTIALLPAAPAAAYSSPLPVPNGYRVMNRQDLSSNLVYVQYRSSNPLRVINIAFLRHGASEHLRVVLAHNTVSGTNHREVLSSMCHRVSCKIAVNGDFFSNQTAEPAGGLSVDGTPLRTPPAVRYHFYEDWAGNVGVTKFNQPINFNVTYSNGVRPYWVNSINTDRNNDRSALYTPAWGPSTLTSTSGFELTLQATSPIKMNGSTNVKIVWGRWGGNSSIPSNGFILSGNGSYATDYSNVWSQVHSGAISANASISITTSPSVRMFVGGNPELLSGGKQAFTNDGSSLDNTSDPHTFVCRTWNDDTVLATIDGRQPGWSNGINLMDGATFMRSLGCSQALNLDGGGSAEFVKWSTVTDRPSDGAERPLAAGLMIVS